MSGEEQRCLFVYTWVDMPIVQLWWYPDIVAGPARSVVYHDYDLKKELIIV